MTRPTRAPESSAQAGHAATDARRHVEAAERAVRRRWILLAAVGFLLASGHLLGAANGSPTALATAMVGAAFLNLLAASLLSTGRLQRVQLFIAALLDATVASTAVVFFGPGALGAALLVVAAAPYGHDSAGVRYTAVATSVAAYAAASLGWYSVFAQPSRTLADVPLGLWLEAAVLGGVLALLAAVAGRFDQRLRHVREALTAAANGAIGARAQVDGADEAAGLSDAGNDLIEHLARLAVDVGEAADRSGRAAVALSEWLARARDATRKSAGAADRLGDGLWDQKAAVEEALRDAQQAAQDIVAFRADAEEATPGARQLGAAVAMGGDAVARCQESAMAIAQSVRAAGAASAEFAGLSERVEALAAGLPSLTRQMRLLSLNAGIEAARAEEHGVGLMAIADEVRTLAHVTGDAARSVTELESVMRHASAGLLRAIRSAEQDVATLCQGVADASAALGGLPARAATASQLAAAANRVSDSQMQRLTALQEHLRRVAETAALHARALEDGRVGTTEHAAALESLGDVADCLQGISMQLTSGAPRYGSKAPRPVDDAPRGAS